MTRKLNRLLRGVCLVFGLLASATVIDWAFPPDLSRFQDLSRELYGSEGELLHVVQSRDQKWRLKANLDEVDPAYVQMLLAREDRYFWQHHGVNPLAFFRAAYQYVTNCRLVSGGSTITMQVARLLEPRPRNFLSKFVECLRAFQLEKRFSKKQILEMYLTLAPFGSNLEGVRSASLAYFGKAPQQLIPSEAALLVALPQSPKLWQKHGFSKVTQDARNRVLSQSHTLGLLDEELMQVASKDPLPDARFAMPREVPHLARALLYERPIVSCTIRSTVQKQMESVAFNATRLLPEDVNIAILVVHHPSREIISYVGSSDFFDSRRQGQVDFIQAVRSPGSTLKPFIYGIGFDHGLVSPSSFVLDDRMRFGTYKPDNFDKNFYGMVTVSDALINSLNIPAVELLSQIGPVRFLGTLEEGGIAAKRADPQAAPGLSIALGGVGLTLEQLVTLYASLPQDGLISPLKLMKQENSAEPSRLLSEASSRELNEILSQVIINDFGQSSHEIAVKTGTSYGYRDAWAVGYNGEYVVGVWIGRPDGSSFGLGTGRTLAVPVLEKAFKYLPTKEKLNLPAKKKGVMELIEPGLNSHTRQKKLLKQAPQMLFPIDGTIIEHLGEGVVNLNAMGGKRPYTWLADGVPIHTQIWSPKVTWRPDRPGFYQITLLDADGLAQTAKIEIQ